MAFKQVHPRRPSMGFRQVHPQRPSGGFVQVHPNHPNPNAGFVQVHPNHNAGFVQLHPSAPHKQDPRLAAVVGAMQAAIGRAPYRQIGGLLPKQPGPQSMLPWLQHEAQITAELNAAGRQVGGGFMPPHHSAPHLTPINRNYDEDGVNPNVPAPFQIDPSTLMAPTGPMVQFPGNFQPHRIDYGPPKYPFPFPREGFRY